MVAQILTGPRRLRVVALGTTATLMDCIVAWRQHHDVVGIVSMPEQIRPDNSADLRGFAQRYDIPYLEEADINDQTAILGLQELQPDILFSMWPKLIHGRTIAIPRLGCIGTHCTPLPANRGRHPLHWMIVLGITESCVSFFRMDEGVDTGDILLQTPFSIGPRANIREALSAMAAASVEGCRILAASLTAGGPLTGTPQDHAKANTWRARSAFDTLIDFRMSAAAIDRLVRSFCAPFSGAKLIWRDRMIAIERAELPPSAGADLGAHREPGTILRRDPDSLVVKADDLSITLYPRDSAALAELPDNLRLFLPPSAYFEQCWPRIEELL